MDQVTVITADVIGSRNHDRVTTLLKDKLVDFSHPSLMVPVGVFRGDELQVVCRGYGDYPEVVRELRYYCQPLELRIGIGFGTIEEGYGSNTPWEMNGTAFSRARKALDGIKDEKDHFTLVCSGDDRWDEVVNTLYLLLDTIQSRWTEAQWEAVHLYDKKGTYREAALVLGIALQNVQKRCSAANWNQVREAEETLSKMGLRLLGSK
ncbi:SatD family protein [Halothermothrix orenii]|uniref:SatD n=1 Tax=Halothermothrix orenii (strain H 168 / OCM 544 / DSM 9562) TaxID=373903 RepID=B8CYC9_HALOH|nr:SatD family protein [Halothermothrix orenii]ACL70298.1 SatD [Halothermothrix orenii H 168]